MRIPRGEEGEEQILNLTSVMDLMFILLIFYVTAASFKEEERDEMVNLPDTVESMSLSSAASKLIVINVRSSQRPAGSPLYLVSQRGMTLDELRQTVTQAINTDREQKILVRGDETAMHGDVANAISACREAGVAKVNIGYDFRPVPR